MEKIKRYFARSPAPFQMFTLDQLQQIRRETFVADVEFHEQLSSTNDRAIEVANDPALLKPTLIVARDQTAGRGRGNNQWWSSEGALTFSLLLDGDASCHQQRPWSLVSLSMGVAICDAILALCPDLDVGLKWPNDVHILGRKVAGWRSIGTGTGDGGFIFRVHLFYPSRYL